jgi:cytochrome P450
MSELDRPSNSSSLPPGPEDESLDAIAAKVLARGRGVAGTPPSDFLGALHRFFARALALPVGIVAGALMGFAGALVMLVLQGGWLKKIGLFLVGPFAGLGLGAMIGWRYLVRGKLDALPTIAGLLHRFVPVVAFPKALTHMVFGLVVVTTYEDVRMVLERNDVFRVGGYDDRMRASSGPFILGMDPGPTYDKEQDIAARAVGRNVAPLKSLVVEISRTLIEKAYARSRTLDVVTEYAHAVQMAVVDRYYGIPNTRDERLIPWLETMSFYLFNLWVGGPYRDAAVDAGRVLAAHIRRVVRRRTEDLSHGGPAKDDVLGRMIDVIRSASTSNDPKQPSNEEFMVRTMAGLTSGATIATIGLFVGSIDLLLGLPPDEREALRKAAQLDDDATVKRFLFEAARFGAYPPTLYRHTLSPFVFHAGTKHEATAERGAWVLTMPILANYDTSVFAKPTTFNPMREYEKGRGPLLFGWAQHKCLGAHMAELLMVEMTKALFAKGIQRAPGPDGKLSNGEPGALPAGDYPARLVVRFD